VAGTLFWEVDPVHTFQQRYRIDDYREWFKSCRFYVVTCRPSVRVEMEHHRYLKSLVRFCFESSDWTGEIIREQVECDLASLFSDIDQRDHPVELLRVDAPDDRTYLTITVVIGNTGYQIHNDTWSLASTVCTDTRFSLQEVLYVGQTFGRDGNRHVLERTAEHKKIQRIYADHLTTPMDVFLTPCEVSRSQFLPIDDFDMASGFLDDDGVELDFDAVMDLSGMSGKGLPKSAIDVIEHSLIAHFKPEYNEKLRNWSPATPTSSMRRFQEAGIRSMRMTFAGSNGTARFFSASAPPKRMHAAVFSLPPSPRFPALVRNPWPVGISLGDMDRMIQQLINDREEERLEFRRHREADPPVMPPRRPGPPSST
jgi:hypothetical protein